MSKALGNGARYGQIYLIASLLSIFDTASAVVHFYLQNDKIAFYNVGDISRFLALMFRLHVTDVDWR